MYLSAHIQQRVMEMWQIILDIVRNNMSGDKL